MKARISLIESTCHRFILNYLLPYKPHRKKHCTLTTNPLYGSWLQKMWLWTALKWNSGSKTDQNHNNMRNLIVFVCHCLKCCELCVIFCKSDFEFEPNWGKINREMTKQLYLPFTVDILENFPRPHFRLIYRLEESRDGNITLLAWNEPCSEDYWGNNINFRKWIFEMEMNMKLI